MIDFPTTDSVAVAAVRPLLRKLIARYQSAPDDETRTAITAQMSDFAMYHSTATDPVNYPSTTSHVAIKVREYLVAIAKLLHNSGFATREGIRAHCHATWMYLDSAPPIITGASGTGVLGTTDSAGKYSLHVSDGPGAAFNGAFFVNWTRDGVPIVASGSSIRVATTAAPQSFAAEVFGMAGENFLVTWTVPGKDDITATLTPAMGDAAAPTECGYRLNRFGTLAPTSAYGTTINTVFTTPDPAQQVLIDTEDVIAPFTIMIGGNEIAMTENPSFPGGRAWVGTNDAAHDLIRASVDTPLTVVFVGGATEVLRDRPRTHTLEEVKGLTKAELIALLSGE